MWRCGRDGGREPRGPSVAHRQCKRQGGQCLVVVSGIWRLAFGVWRLASGVGCIFRRAKGPRPKRQGPKQGLKGRSGAGCLLMPGDGLAGLGRGFALFRRCGADMRSRAAERRRRIEARRDSRFPAAAAGDSRRRPGPGMSRSGSANLCRWPPRGRWVSRPLICDATTTRRRRRRQHQQPWMPRNRGRPRVGVPWAAPTTPSSRARLAGGRTACALPVAGSLQPACYRAGQTNKGRQTVGTAAASRVRPRLPSRQGPRRCREAREGRGAVDGRGSRASWRRRPQTTDWAHDRTSSTMGHGRTAQELGGRIVAGRVGARTGERRAGRGKIRGRTEGVATAERYVACCNTERVSRYLPSGTSMRWYMLHRPTGNGRPRAPAKRQALTAHLLVRVPGLVCPPLAGCRPSHQAKGGPHGQQGALGGPGGGEPRGGV